MPRAMNALHMANNRAYETQRTNNFEIQIVDVGGEDLTFACTTAGLPNESNNPINLAYGNTNVKVAGTTEVADVTVSVKDFIEADIEAIVRRWRREVYNEDTGEIGWAVDYKRRAYIYLYSPDGSVKRTWILEGVWPSSVAWGDLTYDGGAVREISMTLSVDTATIE